MLLVLQMRITKKKAAMKVYTKETEKKFSTKKLKSDTGQKFKGDQVQVMFSSRKLQVEYIEAAAALMTKSLSETSEFAVLQHNLDSRKLKNWIWETYSTGNEMNR